MDGGVHLYRPIWLRNGVAGFLLFIVLGRPAIQFFVYLVTFSRQVKKSKTGVSLSLLSCSFLLSFLDAWRARALF